MIITRKIFVSGWVQGVGFRYFTLRTAEQLGGMTGYVKNLPDGRVEVFAEAEEETMESFIQILKKGPASAFVEELEVREETFSGEYKGFHIAF